MPAGHELVTPADGEFDPTPADFQVALAAEPMGVYPATFALCDHFCALCDQIEGRDGQHATQTKAFAERMRDDSSWKPWDLSSKKFSSMSKRNPYSSNVFDSVGSSLTTNQYSLLSFGRPRARWTGP